MARLFLARGAGYWRARKAARVAQRTNVTMRLRLVEAVCVGLLLVAIAPPAASATHLYGQQDCAYGSDLVLPCPLPGQGTSANATAQVPTLPETCKVRTIGAIVRLPDPQQCVEDLGEETNELPDLVDVPRGCVPSLIDGFDPIGCLDGLTPPLPSPPSPPSPPNLPPVPSVPQPPSIQVPPECTGSALSVSAYLCARALVLQITGQNCVVRDLIGGCVEPTQDPVPVPSPGSLLDRTPPETTITGGPSGTTTSSSATFTFTSSESGSFECRLDGAGFSVCSSPKTYTALSEANHVFEVRAKDRAGNIDPTPARRDWTVDLAPRITLSGSLKQAADAGGVLADPDYQLHISASDTSSGVTNIEAYVDGDMQDVVERACPSGGCGLDRTWDFATADYARGQHTIQVVARNASGRSRTVSLPVTTEPPDRDEGAPGDAPGGSANRDDELEPEARRRWPSTFAGLWQVGEGRVFVAFTAAADANVGELRRDYPSDSRELVAVTLPRSLAELEALQEQMITDREASRVPGLAPLPPRYDLGIDLPLNTVYATVPQLDPVTQVAFASRYGVVRVDAGALAVPDVRTCTRANCGTSLRAGLRVPDENGVACSSAFVVRSNGGGLNLLSAAHCPGSERYHGGAKYGNVIDEQYAFRVDAERHGINSNFGASASMVIDGKERMRPVEADISWSQLRVGRRVCKTGWKTGKTCEDILDKHFSPDYVSNGRRFIKADYCAKGGDSGGAVYRGRTAYGVHSGGTDLPCRNPDEFSVFGSIEYVKEALGVTVVTG